MNNVEIITASDCMKDMEMGIHLCQDKRYQRGIVENHLQINQIDEVSC